jgi:hypothetical protein
MMIHQDTEIGPGLIHQEACPKSSSIFLDARAKLLAEEDEDFASGWPWGLHKGGTETGVFRGSGEVGQVIQCLTGQRL